MLYQTGPTSCERPISRASSLGCCLHNVCPTQSSYARNESPFRSCHAFRPLTSHLILPVSPARRGIRPQMGLKIDRNLRTRGVFGHLAAHHSLFYHRQPLTPDQTGLFGLVLFYSSPGRQPLDDWARLSVDGHCEAETCQLAPYPEVVF